MSTYKQIYEAQEVERKAIEKRTDACRKYKYKIGTIWNGKNYTYGRKYQRTLKRAMFKIWLLERGGLIGG